MYIHISLSLYIYIYIYILRERERGLPLCVISLFRLGGVFVWRDALRGARWGLEYPELLRDIWASEFTSRRYFIKENIEVIYT